MSIIRFGPLINPGRVRPGDRIALPTIHEHLYPLIGAVTIFWGSFEVEHDKLLAPFVIADSDPDDRGWERRNFTKRQELLRKKVEDRFPGDITTEVKSILDAAKVYYWQRNLIVHGQTQLQVVENVGTPYVRGYLNGRYVALRLEADFLNTMFHEIGMLSGRLIALTADDDSKCRLSLPNRLTLQAFVQRHPLTPPTPRNTEPQHPASLRLSPRQR